MVVRNPKRRTSTEHLISTAPVAVKCKGCDAWIMSCHIHGVLYRLDPVRLNNTGEMFALILGAATFEVTCLGRDKPFKRSAFHIADGTPEFGYVHAEHRCGMSYDHHQYRDERRLFDEQDYDDPPF